MLCSESDKTIDQRPIELKIQQAYEEREDKNNYFTSLIDGNQNVSEYLSEMIKMDKNTGNGETFFVYAIKSNKTEIVEQFVKFFSENNNSSNEFNAYLKDGFSYLPLLPFDSVKYLLNLCKEKSVPIDSTLIIDKQFKNCLVEDFICGSIIKGENFTTSDILIIGGNLKSLLTLRQNYSKDFFISFIKFNQIEQILQYKQNEILLLFQNHELEIVTNITKYNRMDIFKYLLTEIHLPFNLQTVLKMGCQEGNQEMIFYLINNFYILDYEILLKYVFESSNLNLIKYITNRFEINKNNIHLCLKNKRHDIYLFLRHKYGLNLDFKYPIYNDRTVLFILQHNNNLLIPALFNAVETGNKEIISNFFERFENIFFTKNENNENLLFSCCKNESTLEIFRYLLNTSLSIHEVNDEGQNLLEKAIHCSNWPLINKFCDSCFIKISTIEACTSLCEKGQINLFKRFYDTNEKKEINNILHIALENGHLSIVEYLLTLIDEGELLTDLLLLHSAAIGGNEELFERIYRLNPNLLSHKGKNGETPIFCAIEYGHLNLVKLIYKLDPKRIEDKNVLNSSLLHYAFYTKQRDIVNYLLQLCVFDLKCRNSELQTPILLGASEGFFMENIINEDMLDEEILEDKQRCSLLYYACKFNRQDYIIYLLSMFPESYSLFDENENEERCLVYVATCLDANFILQLSTFEDEIFRGPLNSDKDTFIHKLIENNNITVLSHLMQSKGDDLINIVYGAKNEYYFTPFDIALQKGHSKIIKLIYEYNFTKAFQEIPKINFINIINNSESTLEVIKLLADVEKSLQTNTPPVEKTETKKRKKRNSLPRNSLNNLESKLDEESKIYKLLFHLMEDNLVDEDLDLEKIINAIEIWKKRIIDREDINWSFSRLRGWFIVCLREIFFDKENEVNSVYFEILKAIKEVLLSDLQLDPRTYWSASNIKFIYFLICSVLLADNITKYLEKCSDSIDLSKSVIIEMFKLIMIELNSKYRDFYKYRETLISAFNITRLTFYETVIGEYIAASKTISFDKTFNSFLFKEIIENNDLPALQQYLLDSNYCIGDLNLTCCDNQMVLNIKAKPYKFPFSKESLELIFMFCSVLDISTVEKLFPSQLSEFIAKNCLLNHNLIVKYSQFIKENLATTIFKIAIENNNLYLMDYICFIDKEIINMSILSSNALIFDLLEQKNIVMIDYIIRKNCNLNVLTTDKKSIFDFIQDIDILNIILHKLDRLNERKVLYLCIEKEWNEIAVKLIDNTENKELAKEAFKMLLNNKK